MAWTIKQALEWLDRHQSFENDGRFNTVPSLDNAQSALVALGISPHEFQTIHIGGTNGKGSTCQIATQLLVGLGHKVGTFTSPHLHSINERIQIDGEPVSDELFADELLVTSGIEQSLNLTFTWFEVLFVTAVSLFYAEGVDTLVLEVGIGGLWDTTNVMDGDVTVVTSIGRDHLEILGPTLLDVAENKAGIIKPNSVAIIGPVDDACAQVIARHVAAEMFWLGKDLMISELCRAIRGWRFDLKTRRSFFSEMYISLYGQYQVNNAALAISAVEELVKKSLSDEYVRSVLMNVTIWGRAEVLFRSPVVIVDVAHNPDGASALASVIDQEFGGFEPRICVVSLLKRKDSVAFLRELRRVFDTVVLCSGGDERFLPIENLELEALDAGFNVVLAPSIEAGVSLGIKVATRDGIVAVTGSFRVVAPARAFLLS